MPRPTRRPRRPAPRSAYGNFLTILVNFLIIAVRPGDPGDQPRPTPSGSKAEEAAAPPPPSREEELLTEIRDLLAKR